MIDAQRRRLLRATMVATMTTSVACAVVRAQGSWPARPVTIVVPYPPGGTSDVLARILQAPLQEALGQPVLIDNRPGASAVLGTQLVAHAAPDGYTLLMPNNGLVISPYLTRDVGYDPIKSFEPISVVSLQPMVLVVHPSLPVENVRQLIEFAKAQPAKIEYASAGTASFGHLATELFCRRSGIQLYHVPYKGQAPTTQAVLTGEAKVLLTTASSQMNQFVKERRLKLLGVTSEQPSPLAPGAVPIGQTIEGFSAEVFFGLLAPAGTPREVVTTLNGAVRKVLVNPDLQSRFEAAGGAAVSTTPAEFKQRIVRESKSWGDVVREANIAAT